MISNRWMAWSLAVDLLWVRKSWWQEWVTDQSFVPDGSQLNNERHRAGEMAQRVRALTAPRKSWVQIPETTWWLTTTHIEIWHPLLVLLKSATVNLCIIINKSFLKNEVHPIFRVKYLSTQPWLSCNSLCRPGWFQSLQDLPASPSRVLGLKKLLNIACIYTKCIPFGEWG